ncbi:MAG: MerR family transcriptional regulator [Patescibacteria group bacterium]
MSYSIQHLAKLAGISVRTLHHYDAIGLLRPDRQERNGYRTYSDADLLRLQQIMFFRELDFSLADIIKILSSPTFELQRALNDQKTLLELKQKRLSKLIKTINQTINNLTNQTPMDDQALYTSFSKTEEQAYAAEAKSRWGHTDAFKQSEERVKKMGRAGLRKVLAAAGALTVKIATAMQSGLDPASAEVQELIAEHYAGLRAFYEPNLEIYRGLANAYINDARFKANYENVAPGLAQFMHTAMLTFCERRDGNLV